MDDYAEIIRLAEAARAERQPLAVDPATILDLIAKLAGARNDALEEAAKSITEYYKGPSSEYRLLLLARAAAIRALKEPTNG